MNKKFVFLSMTTFMNFVFIFQIFILVVVLALKRYGFVGSKRGYKKQIFCLGFKYKNHES